MMLRRSIVLVLFLTASEATAWDFIGTRPLGVGGAHRAIVTGNDAIMLNPAGMSLFRHYSFEAQYLVKPEYTDGGDAEHAMVASVVDNQIAPFATGVAYTRIERGGQKAGNRYDLAFAMNLSNNLFVGMNTKYINFDKTGTEDAVDAVSIDLGLLIRMDFGLHIGVVGYNLTNTADYNEHPVSMGVAAMFTPFRSLELAFDWYINYQKPKDPAEPTGEKETAYSFHFGAEYMLFGQFVLRAGFQLDDANPVLEDKYWTIGAGYISKTLALDFGYQGSIEHGWNNTFGVMLRLFLS